MSTVSDPQIKAALELEIRSFQQCLAKVTQETEDPRVRIYTAITKLNGNKACSFTQKILTRNANAIVLITSSEYIEQIPGTNRYKMVTDRLDNMVLSSPIEPELDGKRLWPQFYGNNQVVYWTLGTGFFYQHDLVITAGHVWSEILDAFYKKTNTDLSNIRLIRSYVHDKRRTFEAHDIYTIDHGTDAKKIGDWRYNNYKDWAWIKVKSMDPAQVPGFKSLPVSTATLDETVGLYCIGHGLGLPMMFSFNWINPFSGYDTDPYSELFECKLGSYAGNSGSPVFRIDTHEVVGVVSGEEETRFTFFGDSVRPRTRLDGLFGVKCAKLDNAIKSIESFQFGP